MTPRDQIIILKMNLIYLSCDNWRFERHFPVRRHVMILATQQYGKIKIVITGELMYEGGPFLVQKSV